MANQYQPNGMMRGYSTGQNPAMGVYPSSMMPQAYSPVPSCPGGNCGVPQVSGFTGLPELQPALTGQLRPSAASPTADTSLLPIDVSDQPSSINSTNVQYLNGFLRTQIGRKVMVEFLIGTNTLVDRTGVLLAVGANYILINEIETDDILACDFYNIKFIKFFY